MFVLEFHRFIFVPQFKQVFMKRMLVVIFFFGFGLMVRGQVVDRFSDGDFTNNPPWSGDGADFYVNSYGQLQLRALGAGSSYLSVPFPRPNLDSCEWRFFIRQNFAPSSSNYGRIYLTSDQENTEGSLNGYYLQFGEPLSADAIELFRQNGTSSVSICRGTNGKIAAAFSLYVKVIRMPGGNWEIWTATDSSLRYSQEASGMDVGIQQADWFSIRCDYTTGNVGNFYFDDVYAGLFLSDTITPVIQNVSPSNASEIKICFSESMNAAAAITSSYRVSGLGAPLAVIRDSLNADCYHLELNGILISGNRYTLSCIGLTDATGYSLSGSSMDFIYYPSSTGANGEVIISEIYFEPISSSTLPYGEYVELYNRSALSINLKDWILSDGSSDGIIPDFQLLPGAYVVLHATSTVSAFSGIQTSVSVSSFPTLNNDVGDQLVLKNRDGEIINVTTFSDDSYHNTSKLTGGWSIERLDFNYTCDEIDNWYASVDPLKGSPGRANSVNGFYSDTIAPAIISIFPIDSFHVELTFSEPVFAGINDTSHYFLSDGVSRLNITSVQIENGNTKALITTAGKLNDLLYSLSIHSYSDCSGNYGSEVPVLFGFPKPAFEGDILINELLSYPKENGTDYVELYNRSANFIDLQNWTIVEGDYLNPNQIRSEGKISSTHFMLAPGAYLVLSKAKKLIYAQYLCKDPGTFLNVDDFPDYNAGDGSIIIKDPNGIVIDEMNYSDALHFPLLSDLKGVSLERTTFLSANESGLWHSAASTAGFGTPGYKNSQLNLQGDDAIKLDPAIFSPDNDGYQDVLSIYYSYPKIGTVLSVYIFDVEGRLVKKLVDGETVSNEGVIIWDGSTQEKEQAASGTYILVATAFDADGNRSMNKKAVVLIRQV